MPDPSWIVLRLEGPLLAFGGVAVDQVGTTRDFPAASMLTGLLASALGYRRQDWERHQMLQDRLIYAARCDRMDPDSPITDTQNAQLAKSDKGWTTWGKPEGRDGASYAAPHRRRRDYHADACVTVCLRLDPAESDPRLEEVRAALERPCRPLFVGRKTCLPSWPLYERVGVSAPSAYAALAQVPSRWGDAQEGLRALWPLDEGPAAGDCVRRVMDLPDLRNWRTGLHGGTRKIVEGLVVPLEASP